jgi:hypothetical protein
MRINKGNQSKDSVKPWLASVHREQDAKLLILIPKTFTTLKTLCSIFGAGRDQRALIRFLLEYKRAKINIIRHLVSQAGSEDKELSGISETPA